MPFIGDTGEACTLNVHCSGLLGDGAHQVDVVGLLRRWS